MLLAIQWKSIRAHFCVSGQNYQKVNLGCFSKINWNCIMEWLDFNQKIFKTTLLQLETRVTMRKVLERMKTRICQVVSGWVMVHPTSSKRHGDHWGEASCQSHPSFKHKSCHACHRPSFRSRFIKASPCGNTWTQTLAGISYLEKQYWKAESEACLSQVTPNDHYEQCSETVLAQIWSETPFFRW